MALHHPTLFVSLVGLVNCCLSAADDSALRVSSGAVQPMDDHPTIRMESCRIEGDILRKETQVRCEFVFVNDGPATTVTMGFPAFAGYNTARPEPALAGFRSWVDGTPVATYIIKRPREAGRGPGGWYGKEVRISDRWYAKRVRFAPGQRRTVRDEYIQPSGEMSDGSCFFPYALQTGASWHGPIGQVEVVLRWTERYEWCARPLPDDIVHWQVSEDGRTLQWSAQDLEPERGFSLDFHPGWPSVYCDGFRVNVYRGGIARVEQSEVWTKAVLLAAMLRGTATYDPRTKTGRIATNAGVQFEMSVDRPSTEIDGEPITLSSAPYIEEGRLWVPVTRILNHFGHDVRIDREEHRVDVASGAPVVWQAECWSTMIGDDPDTRRPIRLTRVDGVLMGELRPVMDLLPEARHGRLEPDEAGGAAGIRVRLNSHDLYFWWNTAAARLDGKPYELPVAPYITLEGTGMAPLEAVCAALDL